MICCQLIVVLLYCVLPGWRTREHDGQKKKIFVCQVCAGLARSTKAPIQVDASLGRFKQFCVCMHMCLCVCIGGGRQTNVQPQQDSGQCQRNWPGSLCRSRSTGAERTQGCFQKWHTSTHARTHKVQPSRQATVNWVEKYGNRCIKAQNFEGLQGQRAIKRQTHHGGKEHNQSGENNLIGVNLNKSGKSRNRNTFGLKLGLKIWLDIYMALGKYTMQIKTQHWMHKS